MSDTMSHEATQSLIDQRLDAIDRALLGLLPRTDRQTIVSQVEARLRELAAASPGVQSHQQTRVDWAAADAANFGAPATSALLSPGVQPVIAAAPSARRPRLKRSWLALSSGIVGIIALVMLFATPITYVIAASLGEFADVAEVLLGTHVAMVAFAGALAVAFGIAALVILNRRGGSLAGHGWAITGLCTGPLPMVVGGLLILVIGAQLTVVQPAYSTASAVAPGPVSVPVYGAPEPPMPVASAPMVVESASLSLPPISSNNATPVVAEPPPTAPVSSSPPADLPPTVVP